MRGQVDRRRTLEFVAALGRAAAGPAQVYLVGGASAVVVGWRAATRDIDLFIEPQRDELLRAIVDLKERLSVSVELASPLDFIPPLPGWRDRSPFVGQEGPLTVRHFDPCAQALAKLERGFDQDLADVDAMIGAGLVAVAELERLFEAIEPELYRFPAIEPAAFRGAVREVVSRRRA